MQKKEIKKFSNFERIANHLMLQSFLQNEVGLFKGQMGVVLATAQFYKHTNDEIFLDFVYDLLEIILSKVNKGLSFSLSNGLSGIG